jgi:hypothetical protein
MTKSRRAHLDQHFDRTRWIEFEFLENKRPALRVGRRQRAFAQDSGECLHDQRLQRGAAFTKPQPQPSSAKPTQ